MKKKSIKKKTPKSKTIKNLTKSVLVKAQPRKRVKETVGYYECLCQHARSGLTGKRITQVCQECRHLAPTISVQKAQEIKKLTAAYKQIGVSLSKLLR